MTDAELIEAIVRHQMLVDVQDGETEVIGLGGGNTTELHAHHATPLAATKHAIFLCAKKLENYA